MTGKGGRPCYDDFVTPHLSVVIPAYNEASVIGDVVADVRAVFPNVVCVDDGGRDDTGDRALFENLARVWRRLGRQPVYPDLVKSGGVSRYAARAYVTRFGSWNKALIAFATFANGRPVARRVRTVAKAGRGRKSRRLSPRTINARLRARVLIRDNCQCRMCGTSPLKDPTVTLQVDHIVPWSKGGRTVPGNLQTLCARCNVGKSDFTQRRNAARPARSAGNP